MLSIKLFSFFESFITFFMLIIFYTYMKVKFGSVSKSYKLVISKYMSIKNTCTRRCTTLFILIVCNILLARV